MNTRPSGEDAALDTLFPVVYNELRAMAHRHLRGERPNHTLGTTGLVHEAYLKLARLDRIQWMNPGHILGLAAQAMRRILVDHAVARCTEKRGGGTELAPLDEALAIAEARGEELIALDAALYALAVVDARLARVVECRFFGGMSVEETAEAMDISPATVKRDWTVARAWLNRELST